MVFEAMGMKKIVQEVNVDGRRAEDKRAEDEVLGYTNV